MRGYKEIEIRASLDELSRKELIILSSDKDENDIVISDFTNQGYEKFRNLFASCDEVDFSL